jgi:nucleoside-diphosphate-sugar epimerase
MGRDMDNWIAVTGGSGLVGGCLIYALRQEKYKVVAIGRTAPNIECDHFIHADITKVSNLDMPHCLAIVHAAASLEQTEAAIHVNCIGTYHMLRLANRCAEKFIYLSSIPIIGEPTESPINENHPAKPNTLYHTTKFYGELLCALPEFVPLSPTVMRIASPIGLGMPKHRILPVFLLACARGAPIYLSGKGQREQNYIDVRDVAAAILSVLAKTDIGGLFLLKGHTVSNLKLAELCCKITKRMPPIKYSDTIDPQENYHWHIDGSHAEKWLGYTPQITLEQSITDIWETLR